MSTSSKTEAGERKAGDVQVFGNESKGDLSNVNVPEPRMTPSKVAETSPDNWRSLRERISILYASCVTADFCPVTHKDGIEEVCTVVCASVHAADPRNHALVKSIPRTLDEKATVSTAK